jgi:hypothetical protein
MGLHFQETMAGTVRMPEGERSFQFTANADSDSIFALGGWAPMRLTGTATLEGVVTDAPLQEGSSLEIGIPLHDYLRYQVTFEDAEGRRYRFFGQKTVRLRNLPQTMTTLHGHLFRDGAELGPATLTFDLKDLPSFLTTWRPWAASAS